MKTEAPGVRHLLIAASLVVIIAGLKAAGTLLTPMLLALFFAVLCLPPMLYLQKRGLPEWLSIALVVLGASIFVVGITMVVGSSLAGFESQIPLYRQSLDGYLTDLLYWLQSLGIKLKTADILSQLDSGLIFDLVKDLGAALGNTLSQTLLVLLTMIFMLVEASSFPHKLRKASGNPDSELEGWRIAMERVQKYIAIKASVSLLTAALATLLTYAMGIDFPLLWGLIAFLFNFIPNIGSVIAALPPMLLALVQHGPSSALIVGIGYLSINMVVGNVVEPKWMGKKLGLSTLVVFLSLIFWNWVWGPVGMVLSVPLTVIVKIILEHSEVFQGVAVMLGSDPRGKG